MSKQSKSKIFLLVFLILTVLCWCPVGYGKYGEVQLIIGMPSWAFFMLVIGALLFLIEWFFLFFSDLALYDKDLDRITQELAGIRQSKIQVEDN